MECNGQAVNAALYPKLAALCSSVPNYQGVFLRGYGSQKQFDSIYGNVVHSSDELHVLQSDTIRNLTGKGTVIFKDKGIIGYTSGVFSSKNSSWLDDGHMGTGGNTTLEIDISKSVPTANENRPINIAVRYIIKAK